MLIFVVYTNLIYIYINAFSYKSYTFNIVLKINDNTDNFPFSFISQFKSSYPVILSCIIQLSQFVQHI